MRLYFMARLRERYPGIREVVRNWAAQEGSLVRGEVVLVKPNCVSASCALAATHADAVRATLEVLSELSPRRLILAEGSAEDTFSAFRNFGYLPWANRFGAEVLDLNQDKTAILHAYDGQGQPIPVRVAKTALEAIRVSLAIPKTHDTVVITAGIKNVVVGAIQKPDKAKIHQGYPAINVNIALLARDLAPHLTVIDGFVGMEGDGPVDGSPVPHRFALVSSHPVAADAACAQLMGFDPRRIGYLVHAAALGLDTLNLDEVDVVGDPFNLTVRPYRPHRTLQEQLAWEIEGTPLASLLVRFQS